MDWGNIIKKMESIVKTGNILSGFKINSDNKTQEINFHVHVLENGKVSEAELANISQQLRPQFKQVSQFLFETPKAQANITRIKEYSIDNDIDQYSKNFVRENIPERDKATWFTSLILRDAFRKGKMDEVQRIKDQVRDTQGERGNNITNLCSANYLETLIIPLYKLLVEDRGDKSKFLEIYETIVVDFPFAVFVASNTTLEEVKAEIIEKIHTVRMYGWYRVSVHGIGSENVKRIQKLALEIQNENDDVAGVDINSHQSSGTIVTVTLTVGAKE